MSVIPFPIKHIAGSEQLIDCLVPVAIDFVNDTFTSKKYIGYGSNGYFYYKTYDSTKQSNVDYYTKSGTTYTKFTGASFATGTTYYEVLKIGNAYPVYMELPASGCEGILGVYYKDGSSYRLKLDYADLTFIPGHYSTTAHTGVIRICALPFAGRIIYLRRLINRDVRSSEDPRILPRATDTTFMTNDTYTNDTYNS